MYYKTDYRTPIGEAMLASDGENLIGLWLVDQKYFGDSAEGEVVKKDDLPLFAQVKDWLDRYLAGDKPTPAELPLRPRGTDFRQEVWKILCEIPYGELTTYGEIAKRIAKLMGKERMSAQAVGGAVGHNPISIIIPCHRVIGSTGSLVGFGGGIDKKIKLLEHEGVDISSLTIPTKGTAL